MRWPAYKHVFFDCDSTLTTVEGIDVLAESTGHAVSVESMTQAAMDGRLELQEIYGKRLEVVNPTRRQIREIRRVYKRNVVEDAAGVIAALHWLGHKVYIISGGLAEPVAEFGLSLGVPKEQIRAVNVQYDQLAGLWWERGGSADAEAQERYQDFEPGTLTVSDGKGEIVRQLKADQAGRSLLVGDGFSDLLAGQAVDLFVGYGGVVVRERVAARAPAYVHSRSLAPVLALAAGPHGVRRLQKGQFSALATKTLELIENGGLTFQDERLKAKFYGAVDAWHNRTPH